VDVAVGRGVSVGDGSGVLIGLGVVVGSGATVGGGGVVRDPHESRKTKRRVKSKVRRVISAGYLQHGHFQPAMRTYIFGEELHYLLLAQ